MSERARPAPIDLTLSPSKRSVSNRGKWTALVAAFLGWMFDGVEIGLFPLVGRPLLLDLLADSNTTEADIGRWYSVITAAFLIGAATGGVLFGWLGDRIGRVRAMMFSVFVYAIFTGLCGIASSATEVAVYRFIAALGMGGEWSLGVALVMEVWPNRSRALLAGLIGAAANVGFLLIGLAGLWLAREGSLETVGGLLTSLNLPDATVERLTAFSGWRLLMLLGAAPALLTFFIRLFVPESQSWTDERSRGATSHWAARDLIGVLIGAAGAGLIVYLWAMDETVIGAAGSGFEHTTAIRIVGTLLGLAVATAGYLYPVIRYLQRHQAASMPSANPASSNATSGRSLVLRRMLLAAMLSGVALLGTWGSLQWAAPWADKLTDGLMPQAKAYTQIWSGVGAILGCIFGALLGDWIGRRATYTLLCLASLFCSLALFQGHTDYNTSFLVWVFLAGTFTASFYGWLPLYLPELFPTRVRATGQGFGFNFGRILAAIGVLQTGAIMGLFERQGNADTGLLRLVEELGLPNATGLPLACSVMSLIYLVGAAVIWLAPETRGRELPE